MKKLVKFPLLETIDVEISITVKTEYVAAADLIGKGILDDTQVLSDWNAFMSSTENIITNMDTLKLLEIRKGKPSESDPTTLLSKYFYIRVLDENKSPVGNILISFRLSTHDETQTGLKYRKKNDEEVAEKYSTKLEKLIPIDSEFIVNKKTFKNYDQAMYALYGKLASIVETYSKESGESK